MKETVSPSVLIIASESLSCEGLAGWRQYKYIGVKAVHLFGRHTADVTIEVWCVGKVVSVDGIRVGVDVNRCHHLSIDSCLLQGPVEASHTGIELHHAKRRISY
jgi:hypothetical protein